MVESPYFNIYFAFSALSKLPKSNIEPDDLLNFLAVNRVAITDEETEFLINLNSDQLNKMSFEKYNFFFTNNNSLICSFCEAILPQTNKSLSNQVLTQNIPVSPPPYSYPPPSSFQHPPPSSSHPPPSSYYPNSYLPPPSSHHPPPPSFKYPPPSSTYHPPPSAPAYKKHLVSEKESLNFSEREVARLMEKEVGFYRDLEKLRKKIQKEHNVSIHEIFRRIDVNDRNFIDFER